MADDAVSDDVVVCDTEYKMSRLLDELQTLPKSRRVLYLDFEGIRLGRWGKLCLGQLTYPAPSKVYLLDIIVLGKRLFSLRSSSGSCNFRELLESTTWLKVLFDPRRDVAALYEQCNKLLPKNIKCLQLCEIAVRR